MKIPLTPPAIDDLLRNLSGPQARTIIANTAPLVGGRYLHWDHIRHRTPPEGLTHEQWWTAVKVGRGGLLQALPLLDKAGSPFRFGMPEPVLVQLHHIDKDAAGQILSANAIATSEHQSRYLVDSLIREAITSSQLEGAATTRKAAEAMLRVGRKPVNHSERMIFNNYTAMQAIREMSDRAITSSDILDLHRILTERTLDDPAEAGRLRTSDDVHVVDHRDGTLLHQPPPFAEMPARLERLCKFENAPETSTPFVHPVIKAILLHFMIGYDHPFVDGNGRTARALFYWSLARSGYWLMEYVSISSLLKAAPAHYVRAYLHTETDGSDTTYFILHQLQIIRKAIEHLHAYLARVRDEQRTTERLLSASQSLRTQLNHRQIALITHALKHPGETYLVEAHQRTHAVAYQTARTDLLGLARLGLLIKGKKLGRAFAFHAPKDLQARIAALADSRPIAADH